MTVDLGTTIEDTDVLAIVRDPNRLKSLQDLRILDTPAEIAFDRVTRLACRLIDAPIALVSLVDEDRQFFKSAIGLEEPLASERETPLSHSFCQYVVGSGEPLIVEDATTHPVVCNNLAIRDFNVIAYLGVPLTTSDGQVLGSFCVIDNKPRIWTDDDVATVHDLAAFVTAELDLRRQILIHEQDAEQLWLSQTRLQRIVDAMLEGIAFVEDGIIVDTNQTFADMFGYTIEEIKGKHGQTFASPEVRKFIQLHLAHNPDQPYESIGLRKDGSTFPIEISGRNIVHGEKKQRISIVRDNTRRKQVEARLFASEARFRGAFDYASIGIALVAPDGRWIEVNQALSELVGYSEQELLSLTFQDITHPDDLETDLAYVSQLLRGELLSYQMEKRYIHKQGHTVWIQLSVSLVRDAEGVAQYFIAQIQNISQRKQVEARMHDVKDQLETQVSELQEYTRELTVLVDMSDMVQVCQSVTEAYDVIQSGIVELFPNTSGAITIFHDQTSILETVVEWGDFDSESCFSRTDCWALRRGRPYLATNTSLRLRCQHLHGTAAQAYYCVPLVARGETLGALHLISHHEDIRETQQQLAQTVAGQLGLVLANLNLQKTLQSQSLRDPLTGLFNRRYLEETLRREAHRTNRNGQSLGIMLLDIDHFKQLNDSYGHTYGDDVLQNVGRILASHVRDEDVACRYGGEEFLLLLPGMAQDVLEKRADEIRAAIAQLSLPYRGQSISPITCSIGVASYPLHGSSTDLVIERADAALYRAKLEGRDCVKTALS